MKDKLFLSSKPLEISEFKSYLEATFLISVLDEYNLNGILIPEDVGTKYHSTIIGQPIVAALKYNIFGEAVDFKGHEVSKTKDSDGNEICVFNTLAIGSVIDSWIEEREVDGYEGIKKCVLIKTKLWSYRYPEFYKVFMKLWNKNNVKSSWEILISDADKTDKGKKVNSFEFIGNCLLGTSVDGAVTGAGTISVAECENDNKELTNALCKDIKNIEISENKGGHTDMPNEKENTIEMSALTVNDIRVKIKKAVDGMMDKYFWVMKIYPYDFKAILEVDNWNSENEDGCYKEVKYEVSGDNVTIKSIADVEMIFQPKSEIETQISQAKEEIKIEYETKLSEKETELSTKLNEIATISQAIAEKDKTIEELKPFKTQVEEAEAKAKEQENEKKKQCLSEKAIEGGYITKEELEESEILKDAIENLKEDVILSEIGKRALAKISAEKKQEEAEKKVETSEKKGEITIDLRADEKSTVKVSSKDTMDLIAQYCCY